MVKRTTDKRIPAGGAMAKVLDYAMFSDLGAGKPTDLQVKARAMLYELFVGLAQEGDVGGASKLFWMAAHDLRLGRPIPKNAALHIGNRLLSAVQTPTNASMAMGLSARRRPKKDDDQRDLAIFEAVVRVHGEGTPLSDGRAAGAYSIVGAEFHLGAKRVEQIFQKWREILVKARELGIPLEINSAI